MYKHYIYISLIAVSTMLVGAFSYAQFAGNICIDQTLRQNQLPGIQAITLPALDLTAEQDLDLTLADGASEKLSDQFCGQYHLIGGMYPYGESIAEANLMDQDIAFQETTQFASCSISAYLNPSTLVQRRAAIDVDGYISSVSSELDAGSVTELASIYGANNQNALPQRFVIDREGEVVSEVGVASNDNYALPDEFPQLCQELNCNGRPGVELDVDGDGMQNDDINELDIDDDGNLDSDHTLESDTDGDGIVNALDVDIDCDGLYNREDDDMDGDGIENEQDDDMDGDGIENEQDGDCNCNGTPDTNEPDSDGDGIPDSHDGDPNTPTGNAGNTTSGSTNSSGCTTSSCGNAQNTTAGNTTAGSTISGNTTAGQTTTPGGIEGSGSTTGPAIEPTAPENVAPDPSTPTPPGIEPTAPEQVDTGTTPTPRGEIEDDTDTRPELSDGGDDGASGGLFAGPQTVGGNAGAAGGEAAGLTCVGEEVRCIMSCNSLKKSNCAETCTDKLFACQDCVSDGNDRTSCACKYFDHIFLNTDIPFVGQCILRRTADSSPNEQSIPDLNTAFPRIMSGLSRLVLTLIVVGAFLAIVVAGFMMTAAGAKPDLYEKGKGIIVGVMGILFLIGISGIILNLINPTFFGTGVQTTQETKEASKDNSGTTGGTT